MTADKILVLIGGVVAVEFIWVWFLTDWGKRGKGEVEKKEERGHH